MYSPVRKRAVLFLPPPSRNVWGSVLSRYVSRQVAREVSRITFDLEYGQDTLEVHKDDVKSGVRVMMVDDVLATGGTMVACIELAAQPGVPRLSVRRF